MDTGSAQGVVLGSLAAAAIIVTLADLAASRTPDVRVAVGAALAAAALYALAGPAPKVASGLAGLTLLTVVYNNYRDIQSIVAKATGK